MSPHRIAPLFCLASLGALLSGSAAAEGPYLEFAAGASFVEDSRTSGSAGALSLAGELSYDTGYNISGAIGYRFSESLRAEFDLSNRESDSEGFKGSPAIAGELNVLAAMVNGYFDIDLDLPVTPFIGGGIGVGVVDFKSDSMSTVLINETTEEFAWNVMGGLTVDVVENVTLSAGYRYLSTTDAELDPVVPGVGGGRMKAEIGMHEIVFDLRYEF